MAEPVVTIPPGTLDTEAFQLQLGADGACRLVLLDDRENGNPDRAVAILTLDAHRADELARQLAQRRPRPGGRTQ